MHVANTGLAEKIKVEGMNKHTKAVVQQWNQPHQE